MNRKQVLGIAALSLLSAAVSAQTVPAEEWVGEPIAFTSTLSRAEVTAGYFASPSTAPQELRVGPADPGPGALARAEVEADRNLWIRAGLASTSDFAYMEPGYAQRVEHYTRMRNGPEFAIELSRIESGGAQTTAMNDVR